MKPPFVTVAIAERGHKPDVDALHGVVSFPLTERGIDQLVAYLRRRVEFPSVETLPPCGEMAV